VGRRPGDRDEDKMVRGSEKTLKTKHDVTFSDVHCICYAFIINKSNVLNLFFVSKLKDLLLCSYEPDLRNIWVCIIALYGLRSLERLKHLQRESCTEIR